MLNSEALLAQLDVVFQAGQYLKHIFSYISQAACGSKPAISKSIAKLPELRHLQPTHWHNRIGLEQMNAAHVCTVNATSNAPGRDRRVSLQKNPLDTQCELQPCMLNHDESAFAVD